MKRDAKRPSQYLVRPHDPAAPKFYVRGHTSREAADKARQRLAEMKEAFHCPFDLIPVGLRT